MTKQLIVGNWKMNGNTASALALASELKAGLAAQSASADVVVCPPHAYLSLVGSELKGSAIGLGAQDCHQNPSGAFTGDTSAEMLTDLGVGHVILGHSERRRSHGEIDEVVREKAAAALKSGLIPIICVGETQDQRAAGQAHDVVGTQIVCSVPAGYKGVIAYEPVWAIGTGVSATVDDITDMAAFIRAELERQFGVDGKAIKILYGGSVTSADAKTILAVPEVGGALVGGASLKSGSFLEIVRSASGN